MDRQIVHLDLDSFFVSVERLKNSKLIGKPVIIGGTGDRGVVSSCSYEARMYGVHSAMPGRMAKRLCPDAIFIRGNMDEYSKYSKIVTEILKESAPLIEKASIDEHYIDASGMDKFIGTAKWTHELRMRVIKETGLPISYGLSKNKTVAKIATNEAKPNGELLIASQSVRPFLNPLNIKKIPGIGAKTYAQLTSMGIQTIHTLTEVPPQLMQNMLGKTGLVLWNKAHGEDDSPVIAYRERKSISSEQTFEQDTIDVHYLHNIIRRMVTEVAYQLRSEHKLTASIAVKLRYANFETVDKQASIHYTSLDSKLIPKAIELFDALYNKRMLVRLVGVKLSKLVHGYEQIEITDMQNEQHSLFQAIDRIKNRFGDDAISLASTI
jgi:DNA polymerase IV